MKKLLSILILSLALELPALAAPAQGVATPSPYIVERGLMT